MLSCARMPRFVLPIALLCASASAFAQDPAQSPDAAFVRQASAAGITEVQAGQVATTQAKDPAVQAFATTMVQDHTAANTALEGIAKGKNLALSDGPTQAQQKALDGLKQQQGAAFDARYSKMMLKDHHQAVALFAKEASSGQDPELKAFAGKTLPTLRHHLSMAEALPKSK